MKTCPNCQKQVEDNFDLCWNCNFSFSEGKIAEIKDLAIQGDRELNCLRCYTPMAFFGNSQFHEGFPTGVFGAIGELFINRRSFDLFICPECGKIEFFSPIIKPSEENE